MTTSVIEGVHLVTMNAARDEYPSGHVVLEGNRITAVGPGPAPADAREAARDAARLDRGGRLVDGSGCLLTPGLVNTHHHLYQWVTRGLAVDDTLFGWLTTLSQARAPLAATLTARSSIRAQTG